MNGKQSEFHRIVDIVVECCEMDGQDRDDLKKKVIGSCREEPIIMMRCILARMLAFAGFTNLTIAIVLHKDVHSVRHLLELARDFRTHSRVYRIAEDEAMKKYQE